MSKGLFTLLGWTVSAAVALAQSAAEPLPAPAAPNGPVLMPLPPVFSGGPVLTPEPTAPCLPPPKPMGGFSFKSEYLLWWIRDSGLPGPLVTTGDAGSAGVLGLPGTQVVYGGSGIDMDAFNGGRWTGTFWLDGDQKLGWQFSVFVLEQQSGFFHARSNALGEPVLARPVIDSLRGRESVSLAAFPDAFAGGLGSGLTARLWGYEDNLVGTVMSNKMLRVGWLAGYRYLRFDEHLNIYQTATLLEDGIGGFFGSALRTGDTLAIHDQWLTKNDYHGGQVGGEAEVKLGPVVVGGVVKVGLGDMHEVLNVIGQTALARPGDPARVGPGGVLAVQSNIARYRNDMFTVVPEVGLNVGVQPMRNLRVTLGYNFLYVSSVIRASDQVNRIVNPSLVPSSLQYNPTQGVPQPRVPFDHTDFWAQGLTFGLELRF